MPLLMRLNRLAAIIIDECIINTYRKCKSFDDKDISDTEIIIQYCPTKMPGRGQILKSLLELRNGNTNSLSQWHKNYWFDKKVRIAIASCLIKRNKLHKKLIIEDLSQVILDKTTTLEWDGNYFSYIKEPDIPTEIPLIIMDSTGSIDHYKLLMPHRKIIPISVDASVQIKTPYVQVTQIIDKPYS